MTEPIEPEIPHLSPSIASIIHKRSALHAWNRHRLLGGEASVSTDAQNDGKVLEGLVFLEDTGADCYPGDSWRGKEAAAFWESSLCSGRIPILSKDYIELQATAAAIRDRLDEQGVKLIGGAFQTEVRWKRGDVHCKGKLDYLLVRPDRITIYDLKCVEDASPKHCQKIFADYGYDIQDAAYVEGVTDQFPDYAGRVDMVFLFCEKKRPFAVQQYVSAGTFKALGKAKWDRAVRVWDECMKSGVWPGYGKGVLRLEALPWQLNDILMEGPNDENV